MTFTKLLDLSELQLPHLNSVNDNNVYYVKLVRGFSEIMYVEYLMYNNQYNLHYL